MATRIDRRFAELKTEGRAALVTFLTAGDPDPETSLALVRALPAVLANTSGFVYYVSITGITGSAAPDADKVHAAVMRIKRHTQLPVAVGFGVRTAKQAQAIAPGAEGVVVGSALVNAVKDSLDKKGKATSRTVKAVAGLVSELANGVRRAKRKAP